MSMKTFAFPIHGALLLMAIATCGGCATQSNGPTLGLLGFPIIPLSPYYQDQLEDDYWEKERYDRVPVLGPITSGGPPKALDPPTPDEIVRSMPTVEGG